MCYVLSVFVRLCFFSSGKCRCTLDALHKDLPEIYPPLWSSGIPFMYRGLPCIYSSAILASASLLSGGNMSLLRVIAMAMIIFMISHTFYPHDRVLESQAWKKVVYAGGKHLNLSVGFGAIYRTKPSSSSSTHVDLCDGSLHAVPSSQLL